MKNITPLLRFLRGMTAAEKKQFAADCSEVRQRLAEQAYWPPEKIKPITVLYLTQAACMDGSPNPSLLTAMPIVLASQKWAPKLMMQPLTYEDLLVPTWESDDGTA